MSATAVETDCVELDALADELMPVNAIAMAKGQAVTRTSPRTFAGGSTFR